MQAPTVPAASVRSRSSTTATTSTTSSLSMASSLIPQAQDPTMVIGWKRKQGSNDYESLPDSEFLELLNERHLTKYLQRRRAQDHATSAPGSSVNPTTTTGASADNSHMIHYSSTTVFHGEELEDDEENVRWASAVEHQQNAANQSSLYASSRSPTLTTLANASNGEQLIPLSRVTARDSEPQDCKWTVMKVSSNQPISSAKPWPWKKTSKGTSEVGKRLSTLLSA